MSSLFLHYFTLSNCSHYDSHVGWSNFSINFFSLSRSSEEEIRWKYPLFIQGIKTTYITCKEILVVNRATLVPIGSLAT